MAKNATAVPHVRSAKPKTTEQIKRAQENDRIAKERLELIQSRQKLANELRKKGFSGRTDAEVIHNFNKGMGQPSPYRSSCRRINPPMVEGSHQSIRLQRQDAHRQILGT